MRFADRMQALISGSVLMSLFGRCTDDDFEKIRLLYLDATDDELLEFAQRRFEKKLTDSVESCVADLKKTRESAATPEEWLRHSK